MARAIRDAVLRKQTRARSHEPRREGTYEQAGRFQARYQ